MAEQGNLAASVSSAIHIGRRKQQQDAIDSLSTDYGTLLILADGMGGMKHGAELSSAAVTAVKEAYAAWKGGRQTECLLHLCAQAQERVLSLQNDEDEGGCTLVLALICGGWLWFLSVGDSRLYLLRRGVMLQLTRDQVYSAVLDERAALGHIAMEEARTSQYRDTINNYIGYSRLRAPDRNTSPVLLMPGDCVAAMSDGVFKTLSDERIGELLSGGRPDAADRVLKAVLAEEKEKQDNCSIMLAAIQRR